MTSIVQRSLDFETYYSTKLGYTLSKMTAEEYIRDPRFQIIGVSVQDNGGEAVWVDNHGGKAVAYLQSLRWDNVVVVGHNMSEFDSLILTEKCGCVPKFYQCTLALCRAVLGGTVSKSLSSMAKYFQLGEEKGDEVIYADGKRLEDFTPQELARYGAYCSKDTRLCNKLYNILRRMVPGSELPHQHLLTKMWAEPRLELDTNLLRDYLHQVTEAKAMLLKFVGVSQEDLRSDAKFAELLVDLGIDPPMKYSKKRKNPDGSPMLVYAFAKTDQAMEELAEDDDDDVATLVSARLGVKTTIVESRLQRLLGISERGLLPVPVAYGRTHTHRGAGSGKINLQNMGRVKSANKRTPAGTLMVTPAGIGRLEASRVTDRKGRLETQLKTTAGIFWGDECHCVGIRDTIRAPAGKRVVVADSSNIELRVAHMLAGQMDTIERLRANEDLYCWFASEYYGREITKADKVERMLGKVAMLQLQYQSGHLAFRNSARVMGGLRISAEDAENTVATYRERMREVKKFWYRCGKSIEWMLNGKEEFIDQWGLCRTGKDKIILPNGMPINYFNLRKVFNPETGEEFWGYDDKEKRHLKKCYGGSITENLCQALARIIVFDQQLEIEKRWGSTPGNGVVLSVHDEVVCVVDEDEADECLAFMLEVMSESPRWWPTLPLGAEGDIAQYYGSAK